MMTHLPGSDRLPGYEQFRVDVVQVPLEGLAAQLAAQILPGRHVAEVSLSPKTHIINRRRDGLDERAKRSISSYLGVTEKHVVCECVTARRLNRF